MRRSVKELATTFLKMSDSGQYEGLKEHGVTGEGATTLITTARVLSLQVLLSEGTGVKLALLCQEYAEQHIKNLDLLMDALRLKKPTKEYWEGLTRERELFKTIMQTALDLLPTESDPPAAEPSVQLMTLKDAKSA